MAAGRAKGAENGPPEVRYEPIEDVERLERYCPGGYHPVALQDTLNGRYYIVHKLGYGSYSTVWLARNQATSSYVAVKVATADSEAHDLDILRCSLDQPARSVAAALITPTLDEFTLQGPNGLHRCLVTLLARVSLADAIQQSAKALFQLSVGRAIAAQLVLAVAFLHSQGVVHADLHLGNVLLRLPQSIDRLTPDELYAQFGKPRLEAVQSLDGLPLPEGVPRFGVVPVWFGLDSEDVSLSEARILLADFGESYKPATHDRYHSRTPRLFVPPEARFRPDTPLSFPADIWSLACAVWAIFGQGSLFRGLFPSADAVTREHVNVLGKLPPEWWAEWRRRYEWFDDRGAPIVDEDDAMPLPVWFEESVQVPRREYGMDVMGAEETEALLKMLRPMLAYRPEERATAEQVLQSDWMLNWGLPEVKRMDGQDGALEDK